MNERDLDALNLRKEIGQILARFNARMQELERERGTLLSGLRREVGKAALKKAREMLTQNYAKIDG